MEIFINQLLCLGLKLQNLLLETTPSSMPLETIRVIQIWAREFLKLRKEAMLEMEKQLRRKR